jgi:hypothetical protein
MAVRDVYFTYSVVGLMGLAGVAYGVRVALRGAARSERVARIGGTALIGQEVMDYTYWAIEPIVRGLAAIGVTPNALTWSALILGLVRGSRSASACSGWPRCSAPSPRSATCSTARSHG